MNETYETYWQSIPVGAENAVTYPMLCIMWGCGERTVRQILHDLSEYDNGDNYILIRSSREKGFYRTDDTAKIDTYRKECLNKGRAHFAPLRKINRIMNTDAEQYSLINNLRLVRERTGLKQTSVCAELKNSGINISPEMLSKMENGWCLPTPSQLAAIARIYGVENTELIDMEFIPA